MFFFLSKTLLFLLSPFTWLCALIGLHFFGKSKWKKKTKWVGIFILLFFTNTLIFNFFCGQWEIPGTRIEKVKKHDVAIILGGMFEYDNSLKRISIRRQGDRLIQALTLYHSKKVDKLLITGDNGHLIDKGLQEARQVKELLIQWGIPKEDIITEERSINTYENAKFTAQILRQSYPHFSKFILVTSGIHMKRALACFEKQGIYCTPFSTDLYAQPLSWDEVIVPESDNFRLWNKLLKETVGYLAYKITGKL